MLLKKEVPTITYYPVDNEWNSFCAEFDRHMQFIKDSEQNKEYFPVENISVPENQKVKSKVRGVLRRVFGFERFENYRRSSVNQRIIRKLQMKGNDKWR